MTRSAPDGDEDPDVQWLTAEELDSWLSVVRLMTWLPWLIDQQLQRDSGLGMVDYQVLAKLSESAQRSMRLSSLAEVTNASLSRLSRVVTRLENRGLVRRESDPADGRFTKAILTEEGKAVQSAQGNDYHSFEAQEVLTNKWLDRPGFSQSVAGFLVPSFGQTGLACEGLIADRDLEVESPQNVQRRRIRDLDDSRDAVDVTPAANSSPKPAAHVCHEREGRSVG